MTKTIKFIVYRHLPQNTYIERSEIYIKPQKNKKKTVSDSFFIVKKDVCGQIPIPKKK